MAVNERILRWSEGKDLELLFGAGTRVEDISFCAHHLDTCDCIREFAWSRASSEDDRREVPISTPTLCEHHAHMWGDMHKHHDHIIEENRHKNRAHAVVLEALPTRHKREVKDRTGVVVGHDSHELIRFFYSADRELHFDLEHIPEVDRVRVQEALDRNFAKRRTFVLKK